MDETPLNDITQYTGAFFIQPDIVVKGKVLKIGDLVSIGGKKAISMSLSGLACPAASEPYT